jgi:hypothetical protein
MDAIVASRLGGSRLGPSHHLSPEWIVRSVLAAGGVSMFDVVDEYLREEESQ